MKFKITVSFSMYHPISRKNEVLELSCELESESKELAIQEAKEEYAAEMGMLPKDIHIIMVQEQ